MNKNKEIRRLKYLLTYRQLYYELCPYQLTHFIGFIKINSLIFSIIFFLHYTLDLLHN